MKIDRSEVSLMPRFGFHAFLFVIFSFFPLSGYCLEGEKKTQARDEEHLDEMIFIHGKEYVEARLIECTLRVEKKNSYCLGESSVNNTIDMIYLDEIESIEYSINDGVPAARVEFLLNEETKEKLQNEGKRGLVYREVLDANKVKTRKLIETCDGKKIHQLRSYGADIFVYIRSIEDFMSRIRSHKKKYCKNERR